MLLQLSVRRAVRLAGLEVGIIGGEPEPAARLPAQLALQAPATALVLRVENARERLIVDDLVAQPLPVGGQRRRELWPPKAQRTLEPARAFRLEVGVADEIAGEETVQVEEGRLRDPFRVGAGERKATADVREDRRAERRRILEPVEYVPPDGDVAGQSIGRSAPFGGQGIMGSRSILVGRSRKGGVAGMERLVLMIGREDQPMLETRNSVSKMECWKPASGSLSS